MLDVESAERIAGYLAHQDGVAGVTVTSRDGRVLATDGSNEPEIEASLAALIWHRASQVTAADDLRGMGKLVSESTFEQLAICGPRGDGLVIALDGGCLMLTALPGQLTAAAQSAAPVINRFGAAVAGRPGG
jgi:hypothetical protein